MRFARRTARPAWWQLLVVLAPYAGAAGPDTSDSDTYVLSVGRMVIAQDLDTDDSWSPNPDLMVRIRRSDPVVSREIARLGEERAGLRSQRREAVGGRDRLLEQREASRAPPVAPLRSEQARRLDSLRADVGFFCGSPGRFCAACPELPDFDTCYACARCAELDFLQARQVRSERAAPPPLTDAQRVRLGALEEQVDALERDIRALDEELGRLRGLLSGRSRQIETSSLIVDFGNADIIVVHPDDSIEVSVWDADVFSDDLFGRTTVTLDRATLEGGTLDVSMPNVPLVRLAFRRSEAVAADRDR